METASKQKAITPEQAKNILRTLSDKEAFIVTTHQGNAVVCINSLEQFANMLGQIPAESFMYHASRGDFQTWIDWLGFEELANTFAKARTQREAVEAAEWGVNHLKNILSQENGNLESLLDASYHTNSKAIGIENEQLISALITNIPKEECLPYLSKLGEMVSQGKDIHNILKLIILEDSYRAFFQKKAPLRKFSTLQEFAGELSKLRGRGLSKPEIIEPSSRSKPLELVVRELIKPFLTDFKEKIDGLKYFYMVKGDHPFEFYEFLFCLDASHNIARSGTKKFIETRLNRLLEKEEEFELRNLVMDAACCLIEEDNIYSSLKKELDVVDSDKHKYEELLRKPPAVEQGISSFVDYFEEIQSLTKSGRIRYNSTKNKMFTTHSAFATDCTFEFNKDIEKLICLAAANLGILEELNKKKSEIVRVVEQRYAGIIAQAFERTDYRKKEDFSSDDFNFLENILAELNILWRFYNITRRVKSRNKLRGDIYELAGNRDAIKEFLAVKSKVEGTIAEIKRKEVDVLAIFGSDIDSSGICSLGEAKKTLDDYRKNNPLHHIPKKESIKELPSWKKLSNSYELVYSSFESTIGEKITLALESLDSLFDSERLKEETKKTLVFDKDMTKIEGVLGQLMTAHGFYNELSSVGVDIGDRVGAADSRITELKKELQDIYKFKKISEKIAEDTKSVDKLLGSLLREFVSNMPLDKKSKEKIQLISKLKQEAAVWKGKYSQYNENNYLTDFVRRYDSVVWALKTRLAEKTSANLEFLAREVSAREKRFSELSDFKSERAYDLNKDMASLETMITELMTITSLYRAFASIGDNTKVQIRQIGKTIKSFENLLFNLYGFRKAYLAIVNHTSGVRDKIFPTTKHYTLPLLCSIVNGLAADKGKYLEYEDNNYIKTTVAEYRKTILHLEQLTNQAISEGIADFDARLKNEIASVNGLFIKDMTKEEIARLNSFGNIRENYATEYVAWKMLPMPNPEQHEALLKDLESEIERKRQQGIGKLNAELQQIKEAITDADYRKEDYVNILTGLANQIEARNFADMLVLIQLATGEKTEIVSAVRGNIESHIRYKKDYDLLKDSLKKASEIFSPAQRIDELVEDLTTLDVLRNIQRTKETEYCTANNDRLYSTNIRLAFEFEGKIKEAVSRAIQLADLRYSEISKTYENQTANIYTAVSHTKGKENELMLLNHLYKGLGREEPKTAELQTKIAALLEKYKTIEKTVKKLTKKTDECRSSPYVEETAAFIKESEVRENTIGNINKFIAQLSLCRKQAAEAQQQYGRFFSETMIMITGLCEEVSYNITHKFTRLADEKTNLCDELDKITSNTGMRKYLHPVEAYNNYRRSAEIKRQLLRLDKQASILQKVDYGKLA